MNKKILCLSLISIISLMGFMTKESSARTSPGSSTENARKRCYKRCDTAKSMEGKGSTFIITN